MKKRQPAKAPSENAGRWDHREHEDDEEKTNFPPKTPPKQSPFSDKSGDQRDRGNKAAGEFSSGVRHHPRGEIGPPCGPRRKNERRPGVWRHQPLKMRSGILQLPRG